jgi:hypothetical protein
MKMLKRLLKSEAGQALPMALILLTLGGFLVVPTLSLMTTNLTAVRHIDRANLELYAADAGVEQVLWNIQYNQYDPQKNPDGITLPEDDQTKLIIQDLELNGKTVDVYLSKESGQPYKITSTATSPDEHSTTVECLFDGEADYSWFFDAAITSSTNVEISPKTVVTGDVVYGDNLNNQGTIDGDVIKDTNLADNWPSASYLSSYYYAQVADLDVEGSRYPSSEITISGTRTNPTVIPRLYRQGNLLLKGGGWARLDGTVYVTGTLTINPTGDCVLDLNGNTFFSAYSSGTDCQSGDAIYLGPKTTLRRSGCFIAVGNIKFNPQLGTAGDKLVGVHYTTPSSACNAPAETLLLSKFQADKDGYVENFSILTSGTSGYVKLAMYAADPNTGEPTTLMRTPDNQPSATASTPVDSGLNDSGLNDITFPKTEVEAGKYYWLAAYSSVPIVCYKTFTPPDEWNSKTKAQTEYASFTFPETLTDLTLTTVTDRQYLLAGNALPFVFIMSINCKSTLQPQGTLYGSIAGDAMVDLQPQCTLTLTMVPDDGLNFPGMDTGESDTTGTPPTIRTYTINPSSQ